MKLATSLTHIETAEELKNTITKNDNVMVCCGRMGPMCIPVYRTMETLEGQYGHVAFRDLDFDSPEAGVIRNLDACRGFMGLPFTVYYKNGKVVQATTSLQTKEQITGILDRQFCKNA
jgi:thioredoxin 1